MALTLVHVEDFAGDGPFNSSNLPAGANAFVGSDWLVRPVGPRKTGGVASPGRSAKENHDVNGVNAGGRAVFPTPSGSYMSFAWFFVDDRTRTDPGGWGHSYLMELQNSLSQPGPWIDVTPSTGVFTPSITDHLSDNTNPRTSGTGMFGYNQWVFVVFAFVGNEARWYYKLPGGELTLWMAKSGLTLSGGVTFNKMHVGDSSETPGAQRGARIGLIGTATIASFADVAVPSGFIDPPTTPTTWYASGSGSGTGDGLTEATAWSHSQMLTELAGYTMVGSNAGPGTGDILRIDPSTAIDLTAAFQVSAAGSTIDSYDGQCTWTANGYKALSGFTQPNSGTYPHVWQATLSATFPSAVMWEDRKRFKTITTSDGALTSTATTYTYGANSGSSANASTYATAYAALEAEFGSSFTPDGVTIYFSTSDGTSPATNGRVYEHSRFYTVSGNDVLVLINAVDVTFKNAWIGGAAKSDKLSQASDGGSIIQDGPYALSGEYRFENVHAERGSKHCICFVGSRSNSTLRFLNCAAEQASPEGGFGSQTPWVFYMNEGGGSENVVELVNCRTIQNSDAIGTTGGKVRSDVQDMFTHSSGGSAFIFSDMYFRQCTFGSRVGSGGNTENFHFIRSRTGYGQSFKAAFGAVATEDGNALAEASELRGALTVTTGTITIQRMRAVKSGSSVIGYAGPARQARNRRLARGRF